jgi:hypothetical protein
MLATLRQNIKTQTEWAAFARDLDLAIAPAIGDQVALWPECEPLIVRAVESEPSDEVVAIVESGDKPEPRNRALSLERLSAEVADLDAGGWRSFRGLPNGDCS